MRGIMSREGYSEQDRQKALDMYAQLGNDGLETIADELGKTINSVRAKLVKEGVYIIPEKKPNQKKNGPSKKEIIRDLEKLGLAPDGLDGATKQGLNNIKLLIEEFKQEIVYLKGL